MITNATISRIVRKTGATIDGDASFTNGSAIDIRCMLDDPTSTQRWNLGATIKDANWVCYIAKADLAAAGETAPALGDRINVTIDGGSAEVGEVILAKDRQINGPLAHFELFLKKV